MTYAMYLLVVYAVYLGYALSSTWIHARDTAPGAALSLTVRMSHFVCLSRCISHISVSGYVLPYIVIVDTSVLFMMGHHRLRHMWEPLSSLGLVVCLAVSLLPLLADSKPLKFQNEIPSKQMKSQIIFIIFIRTISDSLLPSHRLQSCILPSHSPTLCNQLSEFSPSSFLFILLASV